MCLLLQLVFPFHSTAPLHNDHFPSSLPSHNSNRLMQFF
jgi:hypothetical protein